MEVYSLFECYVVIIITVIINYTACSCVSTTGPRGIAITCQLIAMPSLMTRRGIAITCQLIAMPSLMTRRGIAMTCQLIAMPSLMTRRGIAMTCQLISMPSLMTLSYLVTDANKNCINVDREEIDQLFHMLSEGASSKRTNKQLMAVQVRRNIVLFC